MSQNFYETEFFQSDDEANYGNFLCINSQIKPSTSTQLPHSQKRFRFNPYNDKENQDSVNTLEEVNTATINSTQPMLSNIIRTQEEHSNMIRVLLREVKLLRRELKEERLKNAQYEEMSPESLLLNIPVTSADEFKKLEQEIKADKQKEKILMNLFSKANDSTIDKFIKGCLKIILSVEAARFFTWYGRHGNTAVEGFYLMTRILDSAEKKFPTSKINERVHIIKKWFLYSKDEYNKIKKQQKD